MTADLSDPDYIWSVSPLDFAAADRILRTNGLPLVLSDIEHQQLCTTLAAIALLAFEVASQPKWPDGLGATIVRSYRDLIVAMAKAQNFPGAPPPVPLEWLADMNACVEQRGKLTP